MKIKRLFQTLLSIFIISSAAVSAGQLWDVMPAFVVSDGEFIERPCWEFSSEGESLGYLCLKSSKAKIYQIETDCDCDPEELDCDCSSYLERIAKAYFKGDRAYFYADGEPLGACLRVGLHYYVYQLESSEDGAVALSALGQWDGATLVLSNLEGQEVVRISYCCPESQSWQVELMDENPLCHLLVQQLLAFIMGA